MSLKILILFAGIGGGTIGVKRVFPSANVITVDKDEKTKPDICGDVFKLSIDFFKDADLIIASPPCQHYSPASKANHKEHPDLLDDTIKLCEKINKPYIIENVNAAKSKIKPHSVILRGMHFETTRDMRRPRKFWTNFPVKTPEKFPKIFPYYRLIGGGGGWIKEPNKVKRMSIDECRKRYPDLPSGLSMHYYAQIILPEYMEYLCQQFKSWSENK
jgi:hypothetical protein